MEIKARKLSEEEMKKEGKEGVGFEVRMEVDEDDDCEHCHEERDEKRVVKSIPIRREWRSALDKLTKEKEKAFELTEQLKGIVKKMGSLKGLLFGQIEEDLGVYDKNLRYNSKTDEIEILED
jgi:hypothetical protein